MRTNKWILLEYPYGSLLDRQVLPTRMPMGFPEQASGVGGPYYKYDEKKQYVGEDAAGTKRAPSL